MKIIYFAKNGIRTGTKENKNWGPKFSHHMLVRGYIAEEYRYSTWAITRRIGLDRHVRAIAEKLRRYSNNGWDIVLVSHSNGCEMDRRLMVNEGIVPKQVWWYAPAVEADFSKNGLNYFLSKHQTIVNVFASEKDFVLKHVAGWSRKLTFGKLGYGSLGHTGPVNLTSPGQVQTLTNDSLGHNDYFKKANIIERIHEITANTPPSV